MLKRFFSNLLSSFLGTWIALLLFGIVAVIVIISLVASLGIDNTSEKVVAKSVLELDLDGIIEESDQMQQPSIDMIISGTKVKQQSLNSIINGIREGAENKDIKALYINCGEPIADPATLHALRNAIVEFKKSDKPIVAYGDSYTQGAYYVASAADSVFLNAEGNIYLTGICGQVIYFKDLLDKLGVRMEVFKVGTYKSAVEPYIYNEMSAPARAQLDTLYGNMWNIISKEIEKSRNLKAGVINNSINNDLVMFKDADYAKGLKLVDRVIYQRDVDGILANIVDVDKEKLNLVSTKTLAMQAQTGSKYNAGNQVAVLYATGEISEDTKSGINCNELVPIITQLAEDDNVKAVVMRVNSPGGSVFGSAQIADALNYLKKQGKPFIVSMGGYAASGGYWISCEADRIFADPLTVTGSIGIFGMFPNAEGLAHKIGISPQTVATNPNGMPINILESMTDAQKAAVQSYIENGYDRFVKRVSKGRNIKESAVREIAEGRVWDGATALKLKLVDQLGSLDAAIEYAAKCARIEGNEEVVYYPEVTPNIWNLVATMSSDEIVKVLKFATEENIDVQSSLFIFSLFRRKPVQARMIPMRVIL